MVELVAVVVAGMNLLCIVAAFNWTLVCGRDNIWRVKRRSVAIRDRAGRWR